jgi:Flp pilus assembly protein TadD
VAALPQSAERDRDASEGVPFRVFLDDTDVADATAPPPSEKAIEAFRRAAWHQPDEADFHFILGEALLRARRPLEAAVAFEEASWANPSEGQYQVSLGLALWEAGRTGEAVSAFREAVRLVPRDPRAVNGLGVSLIALGQVGEGQRTLRHATALAPSSGDVHLNLGLALVAAGLTDEALAPLRKACELKPGDVEAHVQLGATLHSLGRTADAHSAFRAALQVAPHCLDRRPGMRAAFEAASAARLHEGLRRELGVAAQKRPFGLAPILFLLDHLPSVPRRLGAGLTLLFLAAVVFTTVRVARVYFVHYALQDDVAAIAHMPVRDDGDVLARLSNAVERHGLGQAIRPGQFTIDTRGSYRRITCRYAIPVTLWPGLHWGFHFDVDVERPVLIPGEEVEIH